MRADVYIYSEGYAKSRQNAKNLIEVGNVKIDGRLTNKPSFDIDENTPHTVEIVNKPRFVSRGGEKLDYALSAFGIDVSGLNCIDVGASTGGFTDCLLQRGAKKIYSVDSGHSQLDLALSENERIISIEKYNARYMKTDDFDTAFDLAVMDVSFISQTLLHGGIYSVLNEGGALVSLIKPQFECGRGALSSHGIVKRAADREKAISRVIDSALICGFSCVDIVRSPIEGGSGNIEFLILLLKDGNAVNSITQNKINSIL